MGDYKQGLEVLNLAGKYVIPGLIDAHFHIESSMLTPSAFAAVAVPHGTTAVVADRTDCQCFRPGRFPLYG